MLDPTSLYVSILSSVIIPLLVFILKKLYYLNHKITEIEIHIKYIRRELSEARKYIFR